MDKTGLRGLDLAVMDLAGLDLALGWIWLGVPVEIRGQKLRKITAKAYMSKGQANTF